MFELNVPVTFSNWRDISIFVIKTVLACTYSGNRQPEFFYPLRNDQGLSTFLSKYTPQRIGLLSEVKPHIATHRRDKMIDSSLKDSDVCLANGLQYMCFDEEDNMFTDEMYPADGVTSRCTFQVPP